QFTERRVVPGFEKTTSCPQHLREVPFHPAGPMLGREKVDVALARDVIGVAAVTAEGLVATREGGVADGAGEGTGGRGAHPCPRRGLRGARWHFGQKKAERFERTMRSIVVPHRGQGSPSRP